MKLRQMMKSEKGAVLPFVAIVLGLFAFGFIALVIDVGIMYVEKKVMVTSADAAALAGAQVLRETKGVNKTGAKTTAENYAKYNGAEDGQVVVHIVNKGVILPSGVTDNREVVEVTVGKNESLFFARFLGDEDTDVKAQATATWGYIKKSYIGNFIPLFTFDSDYKLNTNTFLHENIENTNSYGFIDVGSGMSDIKEAIAGKNVGGNYMYDNLLDGKPGNGASLLGAVEERMKIAQVKDTDVERKNTMIGLIPIVDKVEFLELNSSGNAGRWKIPIKYFAYFEIIDVIKQNTSQGSSEALDPSQGYTKVISPIDQGIGASHPVYLLGKFTGEIVEARTLAEAGDQINPNPGGDSPATYSKLIK